MGNKIQISVLAGEGNWEANTSSEVEAVSGPCPCALSLRFSSRPEQASSPQPLIGFAKMCTACMRRKSYQMVAKRRHFKVRVGGVFVRQHHQRQSRRLSDSPIRGNRRSGKSLLNLSSGWVRRASHRAAVASMTKSSTFTVFSLSNFQQRTQVCESFRWLR